MIMRLGVLSGRLRLHPGPASLRPLTMFRGQSFAQVLETAEAFHRQAQNLVQQEVSVRFRDQLSVNRCVQDCAYIGVTRKSRSPDAKGIFWKRNCGRSKRPFAATKARPPAQQIVDWLPATPPQIPRRSPPPRHGEAKAAGRAIVCRKRGTPWYGRRTLRGTGGSRSRPAALRGRRRD